MTSNSKNNVSVSGGVIVNKLPNALTVSEQIEYLKSQNLIIEDEDEAAEFLSRVSYFRLKGYATCLRQRNADYDGTKTFGQLTKLYYFDSEFRRLLFSQIAEIEVTLRSRMVNYLCVTYGPLCYKDTNNFKQKADGLGNILSQKIPGDMQAVIDKNGNAPMIKYYLRNYEGVPFYAVAEFMSFGDTSKILVNMYRKDIRKFVNQYYPLIKSMKVNYDLIWRWVKSIVYARNVCAHHGRLYNANLRDNPFLINTDRETESGEIVDNKKIFGVLICMKYLHVDDAGWNDFVAAIKCLLEEYKDTVSLAALGFPNDWEDMLIL